LQELEGSDDEYELTCHKCQEKIPETQMADHQLSHVFHKDTTNPYRKID